jgi:5'(3')-deoxyribonucleotidase
MLLICFTLMALLIIQTIIGTRGLASFEKILFADAAVSDNMQLLEMFHGKAILFHQYNPNL